MEGGCGVGVVERRVCVCERERERKSYYCMLEVKGINGRTRRNTRRGSVKN